MVVLIVFYAAILARSWFSREFLARYFPRWSEFRQFFRSGLDSVWGRRVRCIGVAGNSNSVPTTDYIYLQRLQLAIEFYILYLILLSLVQGRL